MTAPDTGWEVMSSVFMQQKMGWIEITQTLMPQTVEEVTFRKREIIMFFQANRFAWKNKGGTPNFPLRTLTYWTKIRCANNSNPVCLCLCVDQRGEKRVVCDFSSTHWKTKGEHCGHISARSSLTLCASAIPAEHTQKHTQTQIVTLVTRPVLVAPPLLWSLQSPVQSHIT